MGTVIKMTVPTNRTLAQYMCGGGNHEETQETDNPERGHCEIPA